MSDSNLTDERNKEYKEIFELYDVDKDGKLSKEDLTNLLKALGHDAIENFQQHEEDYENNSKTYNLNEFINIMNNNAIEFDIENELLEVFNKYEINNSGNISVINYRKVMNNIGTRFSNDEIEEFICENDPDNTGTIKLNSLLSKMSLKFFV